MKRPTPLIILGVLVSISLFLCGSCFVFGLINSSSPSYKATATAKAASRATEIAISSSTPVPTSTPRPSNTPQPTNTLPPSPISTIASKGITVPSQTPKPSLPTATRVLPTRTPAPTRPLPTWTPVIVSVPTVAAPAPCVCAAGDYDCSDFNTQQEAQACFNYCGGSATNNVFRLDGSDHDGLVCESLP